MLRPIATLGLAGVLALAGCGGNGGGGNAGGDAAPSVTATTSSPTPTAQVATEAQLKAALLAVADMPGWKVVPPDDDEDDGFGDECKPLAALDDSQVETADAEVTFAKTDLGPMFSQAVVSMPSAAEVSEELEMFRKAFAACPSFTAKDEDGEQQKVTIAPLPSFAKLGDESSAHRLTVAFEGGTIAIDMIVVRVRHHVALVAGTSVKTAFGGGSISATELTALARKAVDKVSTTLP